jgi:hypothetical protein
MAAPDPAIRQKSNRSIAKILSSPQNRGFPAKVFISIEIKNFKKWHSCPRPITKIESREKRRNRKEKRAEHFLPKPMPLAFAFAFTFAVACSSPLLLSLPVLRRHP